MFERGFGTLNGLMTFLIIIIIIGIGLEVVSTFGMPLGCLFGSLYNIFRGDKKNQ